MDASAIGCAIQTPVYPRSAKLKLVGSFGIIDRNGVTIQEGGFTRVTFLLEHHLYSHALGFVGEHIDKTRMRDLDKLLIVPGSHLHFLFPERIFPDDHCSHSLL